jgi:uncharacterized protein YndB with AHSA1/START domain
MSHHEILNSPVRLVYEYTLDAPPEKVWRAIADPALRERWLPTQGFAETETLASRPGEELKYRMREGDAPYLESTVTLQIDPVAGGRTALRIVHELTDPRFNSTTIPAANDAHFVVMRAA